MNEHEKVLYVFRKVVYLLYLEIGAFHAGVHSGLAQKAKLNTAYFQRDKERQAAELFHLVEQENDPEKILAPFEDRTGLTLADIELAFREGDWRNKFGGYNFGGPRWLQIAELAVRDYQALKTGSWDQADLITRELMGTKTNQGYLINQFERSEQRRRK